MLDASVARPAYARTPYRARNDLCKAMHCALLRTVGVAATREFWAAHPLDLGEGTLSLEHQLRHIWDEERFSPTQWHATYQEDLERVLFEHGGDLRSFMQEVRLHANGSSWMRAGNILLWLEPLLPTLFRFANPYTMIMRATSSVTSRFAPGTKFERVGRPRADGTERSAIMVLSYPDLLRDDVVKPELSLSTAEGVLVGPRIFGYPPFSRMDDLADGREATRLPWRGTAGIKGDAFLIDGEVHGRTRRFEEFIDQLGIDLRHYQLPDRRVVLIDSDYECPLRRRVVLRAGCAYGAPVYMFRYHWTAKDSPNVRVLETLIAETSAGTEVMRECTSLHEQLLRSVQRMVEIRYTVVDDSIAIDGVHLCSGVPARILRHCLRVYRESARGEFSFRELKREPSLVTHPKNTAIELRVRRLRDALAKHERGVTLELAGKGFFRLHVDHPLRYEEQ